MELEPKATAITMGTNLEMESKLMVKDDSLMQLVVMLFCFPLTFFIIHLPLVTIFWEL